MGVERINDVFKQLQKENKKAFVSYVMGGDGGYETFEENVRFLSENGAHLIEIGIPFSDPVADGPTIQLAGIRALQARVTTKGILNVIRKIRLDISTPIILMTYLNPVLSYGIQEFVEECEQIGVDGLIIPDLPFEEKGLVDQYIRTLALIPLVTLTSKERIEIILNEATGFLYAVTVKGTTGTRSTFPEELETFLQELKEKSPVPVVAGFGISSSSQVKYISSFCDGVIVGSAVVDLLYKKDYRTLKDLIN